MTKEKQGLVGRLVKGLLWTLGTVVFLALGFYVGIVHPNDKRLRASEPEAAAQPIKRRLERAASLFADRLQHKVDIDDKAVPAARDAMLAVLPEYALGASKRFISPYQVYAPLGGYPVRLEARDALVVPAKASLAIEPRVSGDLIVKLSAVMPAGHGRLRLRAAGRELGSWELVEQPGPLDERGFWRKQVWRFLHVDRAPEQARWQEFEVAAALKSEDTVTVTCEADGGPGCLVGDVEFFRTATELKPNVLFVLADTLRGDAPMGGNAPGMAEFAKGATVFADTISAGNMTSPSTNALLSCRRPTDLGAMAFAYSVNPLHREAFYAKNQPSWPAILRDKGYTTAMIGNVSVISEIYGVGVHHGFDRQIAIERDAYDTPEIAHAAVEWLKRHGDERFLLYVHFNGPHAPYRAPFSDLAATWGGWQDLGSYSKAIRWLYQGEVHYTDRYFVRLLSAIQQLDLERDTIVVLTADHGDQQTPHRFAGNEVAEEFTGSYFDHGATLLDDEVHVPLIMRVPGRGTGRTVDTRITALDGPATLLDLVGVQAPDYCAGHSLLPLVDGAGATVEREVAARTIGTEAFQGRAIYFDGHFKYIRTYDPTDKLVFPPTGYLGSRRLYMARNQLYDLGRDPDETTDLSASDPALLDRAVKEYERYYQVHDMYELVVETDGTQPFSVRLPPGSDGQPDEESDVKVERGADGVVVTGKGQKRVVLRIGPTWGGQLPEVTVGDQRVTVELSSLRLPAGVRPDEMPRERPGRDTLLDVRPLPAALVRRTEDAGQASRRLVVGNPRFESVLREWGYLNDR